MNIGLHLKKMNDGLNPLTINCRISRVIKTKWLGGTLGDHKWFVIGGDTDKIGDFAKLMDTIYNSNTLKLETTDFYKQLLPHT